MSRFSSMRTGTKTLLYILYCLSLVQMMVWLTRLLILERGFPLEWAFLIDVVVVLVGGVLLSYYLVEPLNRMDDALAGLRAGESLTPLDDCKAPFGQLIRHTNKLIEQQRETRLLRGHLYEQITEAAAQEERNRLARDLHDSIKQQIFSMSVSAAAALARLEHDPAGARSALVDVKQSAQEALVEMRAMLQQLSPAPLERAGLIEAVREQLEAIGYRTGAKVTTHFGDLPDDAHLPLGSQEAIFRIVQEALSNIARHARAQKIELWLERDGDDALLRIQDNGKGFDPDTAGGGMGLSNMAKRVTALYGDMIVESALGEGTLLEVRIPPARTPLEPQTDDDSLETRYRESVPWFYGLAVSASCMIYSIALLSHPLLTEGQLPLEEAADWVIYTLMLIFIIVTPPLTVWLFLRTRRMLRDFRQQAGPHSALALRLTTHAHISWMVIALLAGWLLPLIVIDALFPIWSPALVSLPSLLLAIWFGWGAYRSRQAYYRTLKPTQLRAEVERSARGQMPTRAAVGFLVGLTFSTALGDGFSGMSLFPSENDQWMALWFVCTALALVVFIATEYWQLRRLRRQAGDGQPNTE